MTTTNKKPTRIIGFDAARALAIFGMILVNFKVAMGAEGTGPAWLQSAMGLLDGRAAATFVILAGVGLSLLSKKGRITGDAVRLRHDRNTMLKRALFLFIVGLAFIPIWPADILHFYGVYIAIAAFFLAASDLKLWLSAAAATIGFVVLLFIFDYEAGWNFATLEYTDFWTMKGMIRHLFFNGFHPVIPWVAFVFVGMWLGRQDMGNVHLRRRILVISFAIAATVEAVSLALTAVFPNELGELFDTAPLPPMPLYIIAGAATAIVIIMLSLEATLRWPDAAWVQPIIHTGQLALTLYVAHVVVGMGILEANGRLEDQTLSFAVVTGTVFFALCILFAHLWRKRFQRGPLEWVMRKLTM